MKKKLIGVLAIIACLACVTAGCNLTPPPANSDSASASDIETSGLEAAADYLQSMYREDNKETRADYTVIKEVAYYNVIYPITWSVDVTKGVTVKVGEENVKIDVDEGAAENIAYVLTATLTDAEGNTVTVSFSRTVLQAPTMVPVQITEAPVAGTAYKYYVYQGGLGQDMYFAGAMANTYYFKTTDSFEKGVDIYVEYVTGSTELFNLYFTDSDGVKQYIGVMQSGTHLNPVFDTEVVSSFKYSTDLHSIITTVEDGTECYLGSYESHDTISASKISYATSETSYVGHLVSLVDRSTVTDDLKVEAEKNVLSVAAGYVGEASVELATQGVTYPDVTISWALEGEGATLNGNKLTIAAPEATTSITLKATITSGDVSVEKSFTVALVKNETTAILAAAKELASGAKFGNEATLKGVIKSVDEAYSADFGNVTVTMTVNDTDVKCYRLEGPGADVIAAGYTITVTGILENYQGSVQFGKACKLDSYVAGEAPDTPDVPDLFEENTAYKMYLDQVTLGKTLYITGEVSGRYLSTTEVATEAADVYAEKAEGGYKFYILVNDVKQYVNIYFNSESKVSVNFTADSTCIYAYNAETNCWYTNIDGTDYYLGTYSTYNTISASKTSFITAENTGVSQFPAEFILAAEAKAVTDAEKVAKEKENLSLKAAVEGAAEITLSTTGKIYKDVVISWIVDAHDNASITENVLTITNPAANTTVSVVATITKGDVSETKDFTISVTPATVETNVLATFEFGDNGDAAHVDGNDLGTSATYTDGSYTLSLTSMSKVYGPAYDATGNSCIKLGTSSAIGTFTFTVANDVNKVVIKVAKYKAKTSKIDVNGTAYTLTKSSNDGEYDEIEIDTTTTKNITFTTVSGGVRAMINSITYMA